MWLGQGRVLTGMFRYYNAYNLSFPDIGQYFAWIHVRFTLLTVYLSTYTAQVAKFDAPEQTEQTKPTKPDVDNELRTKHTEEDNVHNSDGTSDTLEHSDIVHVVGDIIHVRIHLYLMTDFNNL